MCPAYPKGENKEITDYLCPLSLSLKALDFTIFIHGIKLYIINTNKVIYFNQYPPIPPTPHKFHQITQTGKINL